MQSEILLLVIFEALLLQTKYGLALHSVFICLNVSFN